MKGGAFALAAAVVSVLAGCSSSSERTMTSTTVLVPPTTERPASTTYTIPLAAFDRLPLGEPGCSPASPIVGPEVRGSVSGADLWGLIFYKGSTIRANEEVKIVWRMTGTGDLTADATSPAGRHLAPVWGPEYHGGSNWDRPGAEWGTGFIFDEAGCWQLQLQRDGVKGNVWLVVER